MAQQLLGDVHLVLIKSEPIVFSKLLAIYIEERHELRLEKLADGAEKRLEPHVAAVADRVLSGDAASDSQVRESPSLAFV